MWKGLVTAVWGSETYSDKDKKIAQELAQQDIDDDCVLIGDSSGAIWSKPPNIIDSKSFFHVIMSDAVAPSDTLSTAQAQLPDLVPSPPTSNLGPTLDDLSRQPFLPAFFSQVMNNLETEGVPGERQNSQPKPAASASQSTVVRTQKKKPRVSAQENRNSPLPSPNSSSPILPTVTSPTPALSSPTTSQSSLSPSPQPMSPDVQSRVVSPLPSTTESTLQSRIASPPPLILSTAPPPPTAAIMAPPVLTGEAAISALRREKCRKRGQIL